jgi:hypothetical protein
MRISVLASSLALVALACGSSSTEPQQDPGTARNLPPVENREVNTYGVAYPKSEIGTGIGQRIQNFKFLGHVKGDKATLKTVAMVDFYDPDQKHPDGAIKLIHIQAAGYWCSVCQTEAKDLKPLYAGLRERGVEWITTVAEGSSPGSDSTMDDLNKWWGRHNPANPTVLDPGNANLGVFYKAAALPWNAWVDARSMEILSYKEGYEPIQADADKMLRQWENRTPKAP